MIDDYMWDDPWTKRWDDSSYCWVIEQLQIEVKRQQETLARIWEICHTKTPSHKKAYTHFQEDFDEIRRLCAPAVDI
jgi:hypothetical protein